MKWQDTTPVWQPQSVAQLREYVSQCWPQLSVQSEFDQAQLEQAPSAPGAPLAPGTPLLLIEHSVLSKVLAHLGKQSHEQGGLLLGYAYGQVASADQVSSICAIVVTDSLASVDYDASEVSLRMESRLWDQARARLNNPATPGLLVIGWYHSHPNLGAFFSGTDRRTQAAFFAHPYSVGWVIDPIRAEHACYCGPASEPFGDGRTLLQPAVLQRERLQREL